MIWRSSSCYVSSFEKLAANKYIYLNLFSLLLHLSASWNEATIMYIPCKNNNNKKTNNPPQQAVICTFFSTWTLIPGVDKDFKVPAKQALCLINI